MWDVKRNVIPFLIVLKRNSIPFYDYMQLKFKTE
jgi:hypothetical protein